jgi:hypothetical protein
MPSLTIQNLQLFLVFVVPGFVALKVYDLLIPSEKRDFGSAIIEVVSYSMVNLALMSWALLLMRQDDFSNNHPVIYYLGTVGILFVAPAFIAIVWYRVRKSRFISRWMLHPMPSGLDYFFSKRESLWILFHHKNGKKIGGFYGKDSFASSFDQEADIYVQQVWHVDKYGRFTKKVDGTAGMVVRYQDCDLIEFFKAEGK